MHRHARWVTPTLATLVLAACGGSAGSDLNNGPSTPPSNQPPVQTNTIKLFTSGGPRFEPSNVEVPAGTTVTFVWEDGVHDVTPAGNSTFQGSGDPVSAPQSFPVTFTEPGTYTFFCSVHGSATSGMHGTITVR